VRPRNLTLVPRSATSHATSRAAVGLIAAALALAAGVGCSAKSTGTGADGSTVNVTETQTLTLPPSTPASSASSAYVVPPATSVAALHDAKAPMPAGETEGPCPYIANTDVANLEGDHVYRSSVLTTTTPPGCRFYFYAGPFEAIADIVATTFATATDAYNAMVATGAAGVAAEGAKNLIPGVDAVLYKTTFFGQDGTNGDWACAFAKGKVMVVVHTQQTNVSYNARAIATAVAPKF
jgi:hypothetical protein